MSKEDEIKDVLSECFQDVYSCTRVWSAWSYDTMSPDDFVPVSLDTELMDEITSKIMNTKKIDAKELEDIIGEYEMFYNDNFENNFNRYAFKEDVIDFMDLEEASEKVNKIKEEKPTVISKARSRHKP